MSVLNIIGEHRATLSEFVTKPDPSFRVEIRVPPGAGSPQRVGYAFDYALRIGLAKRFSCVEEPYLASTIPERLANHPHARPEDAERAAELWDNASSLIEDFADDSELPPSLASACFDLVGLDVVHRAGVTTGLYDEATPSEIAELRALYEIVPWQEFEPRERLVLNPHFNLGSVMVLGADADVVLDGAVLEVKTLKNPNPALDYFRQVACYAVLADEFGLGEKGVPVRVEEIGFYLSRAGQLATWPFSECVPQEKQAGLLEFLKTVYPGWEM